MATLRRKEGDKGVGRHTLRPGPCSSNKLGGLEKSRGRSDTVSKSTTSRRHHAGGIPFAETGQPDQETSTSVGLFCKTRRGKKFAEDSGEGSYALFVRRATCHVCSVIARSPRLKCRLFKVRDVMTLMFGDMRKSSSKTKRHVSQKKSADTLLLVLLFLLLLLHARRK